MGRGHISRCLAIALIATAAFGQLTAGRAAGQPGAGFDGDARIGDQTRAVRFRFFCTSNAGPNVTGALAVELEVPNYQELHAVFDFDPFEGPDANAGPLTRLEANGAKSRTADTFTAAGSALAAGTSTGFTEAFMLEVSASRRDASRLRKLAAVLRPLIDGPGQLGWNQRNTKSGGATINASLNLDQARADQLKTVLGPCLGAR